MKKNKEIIDDNDVKFGASLYKFLIRIMGVLIVILFSYNTFMIGNIGYNTYKKWNNDQELREYIIDLNTENEIYKYLDFEDSKEEYLESVKEEPSKSMAIETNINIIILEAYLILLFLYYVNIYNFLENKNLANPFNKNSEKYLDKSIKFGVSACVLSWFIGSSLRIVTIEMLLIIALVRYLIRTGNQQIKK